MKSVILMLFSLAFLSSTYAQLTMKASTDKSVYDYGEKIHIVCSVHNDADTAVSLISHSAISCDAQFTFDDYRSSEWTACLATMMSITFSPNTGYSYYWTMDPAIFGLPNKSGVHTIIVTCSYSTIDDYSNGIEFADTIYIEAPEYLGGQLEVSFSSVFDSSIAVTKDSLGVTVFEQNSSESYYTELWSIQGYNLDTLFSQLNADSRFGYVELQRSIQYDSVSTPPITSIQDEATRQLTSSFQLSYAYPNPFNPSCKFYVELPETQEAEIELFNAIGERIAVIHKGVLQAKTQYTFEINGGKLPSGVYFYRVSTPNYEQAKKVVLLK